MWVGIIVIIVLALAGCITVAATYGAYRWNAETSDLRNRLETARLPIQHRIFDVQELDGLPAPVQHYFRLALKEGQPVVAAASVEHAG